MEIGADMELSDYFKAIVDADRAPIVICDIEHVVVYMNPAARERYAGQGGDDLVGRSIFDCHSPKTSRNMAEFLAWFQEDPDHNTVYEGPGSVEDKDVYMVALRDGNGSVIGYYEKHEYRTHDTRELFARA